MKRKNEIKIMLNKIERKLWWCSFYFALFERLEGVKNNPSHCQSSPARSNIRQAP